ncbi:hypothetical protein BC826DRAFT_1049167, partial [Russula brevipes]
MAVAREPTNCPPHLTLTRTAARCVHALVPISRVEAPCAPTPGPGQTHPFSVQPCGLDPPARRHRHPTATSHTRPDRLRPPEQIL